MLKLSGRDDAEIRYDAELGSDDQVFRGAFSVVLSDGRVSAEGFDESTPAWLLSFATKLMRTQWNRSQGKAQQPWPRKLHRWREER